MTLLEMHVRVRKGKISEAGWSIATQARGVAFRRIELTEATNGEEGAGMGWPADCTRMRLND